MLSTDIFCLTVEIFCCMVRYMEKLTKYSFAFTKDDIRALESIKKQMRETQGKVANIGAIRLALRIAVREGAK
jgi:hypothetical protein